MHLNNYTDGNPDLMEYSNEDGKILVVEDNELNQEVAKRFLNVNNLNCDVADTGEEAVKVSKTKKYAIILMDIQLPKMSGTEALHIIREDIQNPNHDTIIIATSAYALIGDKERFMNEGFDNYIPKPIILKEFISMIQKYLEN